MKKTKTYYPLFFVLIISLPLNIKAQTKEYLKTKLGLNLSTYTLNSNNSIAISPKFQFSRLNYMQYSIGPLFKLDSNYKTMGLDFSAQFRFDKCKQNIIPIMVYGIQYFKTKSAPDSIQKNLYLTVGLGFGMDFKITSFSTMIGFGINAITNKSDLWFIKVAIGFPKLYSYKSLIQPKIKSKRHIKS